MKKIVILIFGVLIISVVAFAACAGGGGVDYSRYAGRYYGDEGNPWVELTADGKWLAYEGGEGYFDIDGDEITFWAGFERRNTEDGFVLGTITEDKIVFKDISDYWIDVWTGMEYSKHGFDYSPLDAPQNVRMKIENPVTVFDYVVTWDEVAGAGEYRVRVLGNDVYTDENEYDLIMFLDMLLDQEYYYGMEIDVEIKAYKVDPNGHSCAESPVAKTVFTMPTVDQKFASPSQVLAHGEILEIFWSGNVYEGDYFELRFYDENSTYLDTITTEEHFVPLDTISEQFNIGMFETFGVRVRRVSVADKLHYATSDYMDMQFEKMQVTAKMLSEVMKNTLEKLNSENARFSVSTDIANGFEINVNGNVSDYVCDTYYDAWTSEKPFLFATWLLEQFVDRTEIFDYYYIDFDTNIFGTNCGIIRLKEDAAWAKYADAFSQAFAQNCDPDGTRYNPDATSPQFELSAIYITIEDGLINYFRVDHRDYGSAFGSILEIYNF